MSPSPYSREELEAIKSLRARVKDLKLDEDRNSSSFLIRWLRARELNVPAAETMLRDSMKWRKEVDVDNCAAWVIPDSLKKFLCLHASGHDKDGSPVYIGTFDASYLDVFFKHDKEDIKNYIIQTLEIIDRAAAKSHLPNKQPTRDAVLLVDMTEVELRKLINAKFIEFLRDAVSIANLNYPELEKSLIAVNCPRIISFCMSLIKPFLPARTMSKIRLYGYNKTEWTNDVHGRVNEDQLPSCFAGTNVKVDLLLSEFKLKY